MEYSCCNYGVLLLYATALRTKNIFIIINFFASRLLRMGMEKKHQFLQSWKSWLVSCSSAVEELSHEMVVPVLTLSCRQSKISALRHFSPRVFPGWEMLAKQVFQFTARYVSALAPGMSLQGSKAAPVCCVPSTLSGATTVLGWPTGLWRHLLTLSE